MSNELRVNWSLQPESGSFELSPDELEGCESEGQLREMINDSVTADFESKSLAVACANKCDVDRIVAVWAKMKNGESE